MRKTTLILLLIFLNLSSYASVQALESLIIKGDTFYIQSEPLESYLRLNEPRSELYDFLGIPCHTGLWRGYIGHWKIENQKLYLIDVFACGDTSKSIKENIFASKNKLIFANWFTGQIYIPKGKLLRNMYLGHPAHYEEEIVLHFKNGVLESETVFQNGEENDSIRISRKRTNIIESIYERVNWDSFEKLTNKRYEIKLALDTSGKVNLLEIGRIEKLNGQYILVQLLDL